MWNDKKSIALSKCCVVFFMALLLMCAILAPRGFRLWIDYMPEGRMAYFLTTVYLGSVPAAALLVLLFMLLNRLGRGQVFVGKNVESLRYISWCCFTGAVISLVSALYWFPWVAVGVAAAFMGLVVRVIKNIVAKAVSLQDEADLTI